MSDGFHRVASLKSLSEREPNSVQLPDGMRVCMVRSGQEVFAFEDRCPHRDFALSGGEFVAPNVIECPWHGAQFDCRTGNVVQGPATDPLDLLPVQVSGDDVLIRHDAGRRDRSIEMPPW